jgi:methionyl-tRNA synthetase
MNEKKFITTPIYYVNDRPHIGHSFTTLIADVYSRYYKEKLGAESVFFLTGTDEHGLKIAQAAEKHNMSPEEYTNMISQEYKDVWKKLDIQYDYFIRTTNPKHKTLVQKFIKDLYDNGYVYKGAYKGYYCIGCEKYLNDDEIVSGACRLHPNIKLNYRSEESYFFKLSKFQNEISTLLTERKYEVYPEERCKEIIIRVKEGIKDISVSRRDVDWGIPLPWDESSKVYVWVDALLNYYSALQITGKEMFWPPDIQFMAKDILWFHSVIWEGLLLANKLELPKKIFAHGFFTVDGQKMSKTTGNIIDPVKLVGEYGTDATRYLLLSSFNLCNDGDISLSRMKERYNADLANGLGNLVSRLSNLCVGIDFEILDLEKTKICSLDKEIGAQLDKFNPHEALKIIWGYVNALDRDLAIDKPWLYDGSRKKTMLSKYRGQIIDIAIGLIPFMPKTAERIINTFSKSKIEKIRPLFVRKI